MRSDFNGKKKKRKRRRVKKSWTKKTPSWTKKSRMRLEVISFGNIMMKSLTPSSEMTEEEKASLFIAPEFLEFVEQSSKIVQRALNDGYD